MPRGWQWAPVDIQKWACLLSRVRFSGGVRGKQNGKPKPKPPANLTVKRKRWPTPVVLLCFASKEVRWCYQINLRKATPVGSPAADQLVQLIGRRRNWTSKLLRFTACPKGQPKKDTRTQGSWMVEKMIDHSSNLRCKSHGFLQSSNGSEPQSWHNKGTRFLADVQGDAIQKQIGKKGH